MKILVADTLSESAQKALNEPGVEVAVRPELTAADLPGAIAEHNVLVVRSTKVDAQTIAAGQHLSLIVRAGAGVNTIDVEAASARGIYVSNCPGQNSDAVAELAIGLLVACDRSIANATADLRAGKWNKKQYSDAQGLKGRTLGILGLGMIGQAVASRAQAMEMKVLAWSRSLTPNRAGDLGLEFAASPLEVARGSDAVSIHLAASAETQRLVDAQFLEAMPWGSILVNTSRGDIVDTVALKEAVRTRGLRVGLDVFDQEPAGGTAQFVDTGLASMVTCTPHIGASTNQASEAIASEVVRIIKAYRSSGRPPNAVNICAGSSATHTLVIRHYNRVGVLATVLDALREAGINVEEMQNSIFAGDQAACCTLQLDSPPAQSIVAELASDPRILQIQLEPR